MNIYSVTYQDNTLLFLASDQDHLLTLVSQLLDNYDYCNLISKLQITKVAGNNHNDGFDFYLGLVDDNRPSSIRD